ncbi:mercuric reductase [Fistulifera solaris]|uniref:Mercuric reductase n=1 Tax=Fistulifera solaris TaxID=1519565 RepID=A0A1Z5K266_FISSO|nr:mercuric reductase [Fistulifera solaris]|eukprot:GAX20242.1 mercuric reductase [Fistulifera solaris]
MRNILYSWSSLLIAIMSHHSVGEALSYDVVIIGGGSAGITAAKLIGTTLQKSVALIEKERMGGDCTWTGCIPSKSLLAVAKEIHAARKWGFVTTTTVDWPAIRTQIQANIQHIYDEDDSPEAMQRYGVEIISGKALLSPSGNKTVQVTKSDGSSVTLTAKKGIILCTGATARIPTDHIVGLNEVPFVTTESIWSLPTLPQRLTVVGGGPVGCELAQAFARLGSQVTLIAPTLLPTEDPQVSLTLQQVFESEGIQIIQGRAVAASMSSGSSSQHTIQVQTNDGSSTESVVGDTLLLALGRVPRVEGLEEAGIRLNAKGGIEVNKKLQTSVKHVYAAGDCTGDRQFTHYAGFQGAIAARNILLPLTDPGVLDHVPSTTFTSPEVASIGMSEAQATATYGADQITIVQKEMKHVDRAICEGATDGFLKIVLRKKNQQILGATIVGPTAGELIGEIAVAMAAKLPFDQLTTVMHPYPTFGLSLQLMASEVYYAKLQKNLPLYGALTKIGL